MIATGIPVTVKTMAHVYQKATFVVVVACWCFVRVVEGESSRCHFVLEATTF